MFLEANTVQTEKNTNLSYVHIDMWTQKKEDK